MQRIPSRFVVCWVFKHPYLSKGWHDQKGIKKKIPLTFPTRRRLPHCYRKAVLLLLLSGRNNGQSTKF